MRRCSSDGEVPVDFAAGLTDGDGPPGWIAVHRLVPDRQRVGARRHPVDAIPPLVVGHREIAVREDEDEGAHVRVDLAEDAHDPRPLEPYRLGLAGGVASEGELLSLRA